MIEKARLTALVEGRVQGVYFRAFVEKNALTLKLTGYVKNLPAGQVQTIAEGERESLEKFLRLLHQGPPRAEVRKVNVQWQEYEGNFDDFTIEY